MKNILLITLLAFGFGACSNGQNAQGQGKHNIITADEFAKRPANAQLVDVRTPGEWNEGIIEGALLIDFQQADFKKKIEKLDRSKPVYVYCAVGGRSGNASRLMQEMGFKEVNDLKGGMGAWSGAKKPVVRP
jgi:phage shock protein E